MTDGPADAGHVVKADAFFDGSPLGSAVLEKVRGVLPDAEIRVTRSQVAIRYRRGAAYLWRPRRWLGGRAAEVVLSIALPYEVPSPRWKEVAHPSPGTWMHHLELASLDEVDAEVEGWLLDAAMAAGRPRADAPQG